MVHGSRGAKILPHLRLLVLSLEDIDFDLRRIHPFFAHLDLVVVARHPSGARSPRGGRSADRRPGGRVLLATAGGACAEPSGGTAAPSTPWGPATSVARHRADAAPHSQRQPDGAVTSVHVAPRPAAEPSRPSVRALPQRTAVLG